MFFTAALLFLLGSTLAEKVPSQTRITLPDRSFMLQMMRDEDSTILADNIIGQLKESFPNQLPFPNLSYGLSDLEQNSSYIGKLTSSSGWITDLKTLHRASPVVTSVSGNNLTISTTVSFGTLLANWPYSELLILGVPMFGDTTMTFRQNEFAIELTIFTNPDDGSCGVEVDKAGFSVLSAIDLGIRPVGFFNQIQLDASVNHLSQAIFEQMNYIDKSFIQSVLEKAICTAIPH